MKMRLNPVFEKECRMRVRSIRFALTLLMFNLVLVAIALIGFELAFNLQMNIYIDYSVVSTIYIVLIVLEAVMVAFLVPTFTAGSIAGEREKQTLEILLTTVMKPSQIVVGKLMSSLSMILLLIVSSLPIISIVFTIGGVGLTDLLQFVVEIFIFSLLVGSLGMMASAMVKKTVMATVVSFAYMILLCAGTACIVVMAYGFAEAYYLYNPTTITPTGSNQPNVSWVMLILLFNPAFTMIETLFRNFSSESLLQVGINGMNGSYSAYPTFLTEHWVGISMIVQILLAVFFLWIAKRYLDPLRKIKYKNKKGKRAKKQKTEKTA